MKFYLFYVLQPLDPKHILYWLQLKTEEYPVSGIFFTSSKYAKNVISCSFIYVYNGFPALELLTLRVDNTCFFFWKRDIVATMLEGYLIQI